MSSKYRSSAPPIKNFTQCAIEIIRPKNNAQIGKGTSSNELHEGPYRLGWLLTDRASVVVERCWCRWCHQQINSGHASIFGIKKIQEQNEPQQTRREKAGALKKL